MQVKKVMYCHNCQFQAQQRVYSISLLDHLSFLESVNELKEDSESTRKQYQAIVKDVLILCGTVDWAWSADD